jgi:hypothetical protein
VVNFDDYWAATSVFLQTNPDIKKTICEDFKRTKNIPPTKKTPSELDIDNRKNTPNK